MGRKEHQLTDDVSEAWDWYAWYSALHPAEEPEIEDRREHSDV